MPRARPLDVARALTVTLRTPIPERLEPLPRAPARPAVQERPDLADLADAADRDAVARVLDGDVDAYASIVRRHGAGLVAFCARLAGDASVGEELAQDALARAYGHLGRWRGDSRFRHWLYRIARNCAHDYLKAGARAERPVQEPGADLAGDVDVEREVGDRQLARALAQAVDELPVKYRETFLLFHAEGMDYETIRAVTGVSVAAAKVRVHRARRMLRRALGAVLGLPDAPEEGP